VVIIEDPYTPKAIWVHWLVYDITIMDAINDNSIQGTSGMNTSKQQRRNPAERQAERNSYFVTGPWYRRVGRYVFGIVRRMCNERSYAVRKDG
jgi:phosphatidylethanolamine-binding protein (PEBP) family uncharacterized protein